MGTGSFLGVKRLELGFDHPHTSSTEVKERFGLFPLWGLVAYSRVNLPNIFTTLSTFSSEIFYKFRSKKK